jgi:hypothetical protein
MKEIKKGFKVITLRIGERYINVFTDLERKGLYINFDHDRAEWCAVMNCYIDYCPYPDTPCTACPDADCLLIVADFGSEKIIEPVRKII